MEKRPIPKTKTCPSCNKRRGSKFFHKNGRRYDGLDWRCKDCKKASVNRDARRLREQGYYEKEDRRKKVNARQKARDHFGVVIGACSILMCGKNTEEIHHIDYDEPLLVIPLCKEHHRLIHQKWIEKQ